MGCLEWKCTIRWKSFVMWPKKSLCFFAKPFRRSPILTKWCSQMPFGKSVAMRCWNTFLMATKGGRLIIDYSCLVSLIKKSCLTTLFLVYSISIRIWHRTLLRYRWNGIKWKSEFEVKHPITHSMFLLLFFFLLLWLG